MRQHGIILVILLLLSIIDFTFAAPVPTQEERQTCVDVPKDMMPVVEKRGDDDLVEKLTAYFEKLADPHASSSSPPSGFGHESMNDVQTSSSPPMGGSTSDVQMSYSPTPELEHESMSDAPGSSSLPPALEHEPMSVEQASAPSPEPAPSTTNPDPFVKPPKPLSTELSTYTPASKGPPSYTSTDYGSDEESVGSHASQLSYPSDWDYFLNPQDYPDPEGHAYHPDSPPPSPPQHQNGFANGNGARPPPLQLNGFAHGDDEHQPPSPQQNGFAHGNGLQQPPQPQPNGFAHGEMGDAASTHSDASMLSDSSWTPPDIPAAHDQWLQMVDAWYRANHPDPPLPLQQDEFAHGPQMEDVRPPLPQEHDVTHGNQVGDVALTNPPAHTPASAMYGWDDGSPGTHAPEPDTPLPEYHWLQPGAPEYAGAHVPSPLPQVDDVAHGTQVNYVPLPQEGDVAHGTQ